MWGYVWQTIPVLPARGICTRVVDGERVADGCVAPAWPVTAATRLADGRVVLGGTDGARYGQTPVPAAAPAGFAVVPADGATPVPVRGDEGDGVVDLTAAWPGTTVWALTTTGDRTVLQVSGPTPAPVVTRPRHRTAARCPTMGAPAVVRKVSP